MLTGTVLGYDREGRAWIEQDQCAKRIVTSLENNTVNTTHFKKGSVVEFWKKEVRGLWWAEVTRLTRPPLTFGALLTGVVVSRYWDPKMRDIVVKIKKLFSDESFVHCLNRNQAYQPGVIVEMQHPREFDGLWWAEIARTIRIIEPVC